MSALLPRRAQALVTEALADTRVVLVNGARQAGKSTLTRSSCRGRCQASRAFRAQRSCVIWNCLPRSFSSRPSRPWSSNLTRRAVGTPKLAFVDTGVASHLIGQDAARLAEPGGAAGPMMENLVVMELARQLTWSDERGTLYHYRTKDGVEQKIFNRLPDDTRFHPGHGKDSTLGAERPHLAEWRARGW
jgi:predicted AAA+ superfamily ATPase